jgi:SAM-dependent methyltransferase
LDVSLRGYQPKQFARNIEEPDLKDPYLRELLNVFWLRPETALWRACDIRAMANFRMVSPSLDLGCGDGIFSFIRAGGALREDFDAFRSVGSLDRFFQNVDIFDHFQAGAKPYVRVKPGYSIDVGFDHKANLLRKAGELKLYTELSEGDGNAPLPFADASFRSIFSNIVYWLSSLELVLGEIRRVMSPDGQACLLLPDASFPDYSFYNRFYKKPRDERFKFLELLDRGRHSDNVKQSKSDQEWRSLFDAAGLAVLTHKRHLSGPIVQTWDVGLRPLFPVLKKMTDKIGESDLAPLKAEWIDICATFLEPFVDLDADLSATSTPAFHCYVLGRK